MTTEFNTDGRIDKKILNMTHSDLDGVSSSMMLKSIYTDVTVVPLAYGASNKLTNYINEIAANPLALNKYDMIYITDLSLHIDHMKKLVTAFAVADYKGVFIYLDHHDSSIPFHNPANNIFIVPDICGAMLTKRYLENIYDVKLSKYDNFIDLVNDYDLWIHKNPNSKRLAFMYDYYLKTDRDNGFENFLNHYIKTPIDFQRLSTLEVNVITAAEKAQDDAWESLEVTPLYDSKIGFMMVDPNMVNEMSDRVLKNTDLEVIINYPPNYGVGSIRASDKNIKDMNVAKVVKFLFENGNTFSSAGGHQKAAGHTIKGISYKMSASEKWPLIQKATDEIARALIQVYPELVQ